MIDNCRVCQKSTERKCIFLPFCGFGVCYEHIEYLGEVFNCPVCNDHTIDKEGCLNMRINLEKIDFIKQEKIDTIGKNPEIFIENVFSQLINEVDLKREKLLLEIGQKVNDYSKQLIDQIEKHKKILRAELKLKMEQFDENKDSIKTLIECIENVKFFEGQDLEVYKLASYFGRVNFAKLANKECSIVDVENFKLKRTFKTYIQNWHKYTDQFETGEILVCTENHIQILDEELKQILKDIKLYADIKCAKIYNCNEIVCVLKSGHIKIFDKNTGQIVNEIELSNPSNTGLEIWSDKIVVSSGMRIKIWDPKIKKWTFELDNLFLRQILLLKRNILLGYNENLLVLWDLDIKEKLKSIDEKEIVKIDKINDDEFVSVHETGFYKIWCSNRFECKFKFDTQLWKIKNLISLPNNRFLIYSEEEGFTLWLRNETVYSSSLKIQSNIYSMKILRSGHLLVTDYSSNIQLFCE